VGQIFSNYATALRKCGRFDDALHWYDKALSAHPNDANCHAAVGYTFHLMQR
jgi:tetratricopeptide (TPR) repeat protein